MRFAEVFYEVEVQTEFKVCRYSYAEDRRIYLEPSSAVDYELKYIYVDDGVLHFEVSSD